MRAYQTIYGDQPMQYQTGFGNLGNGLSASLFTSYNKDVVDLHMKWLAEVGIKAVAIGRFNPAGITTPDITAGNVRDQAPKYGVKYYISYDISGWTTFDKDIPNDWTNVIKGNLKMIDSSNYAHQNGKPVVEIWGVSASNNSSTVAQSTSLLNWFQSQGVYVILGVPHEWLSNTEWYPVYNMANMIQPWMIGVIGSVGDSDNWKNEWVNDLAYTNANGLDFQVSILPGDDSAATPQRLHGDFMWEQFANATSAGVKSAFISMYDEFGEGNQIMPTAEDASMNPKGVNVALDIDGVHCSSDYYMRLTGDGAKMLKGQLPLTYVRPTQPVVQVRRLVPGSVVSLQSLANGADVTADNEGASPLIANRNSIGPWEEFQVVDAGNGDIALKSLSNNLFVTAENAGTSPLIANRTAVGPWETFTEIVAADGNIALRAKANNLYVSSDASGFGPLLADGSSVGTAQTFIATAH
jgi:hypothetical protein